MIFTKPIEWIYFLLFVSLAGSDLAFAHGEDKPGPNGGIVRMPSGFHSEVVPVTATRFKVYLLDFYFKNPTIQDSKVDGTAEIEAKSFPIKCQPNSDYYECTIQSTDKEPTGKLKLVTVRNGMAGAEMTYDLPLQSHQGHEKHHHADRDGGEK